MEKEQKRIRKGEKMIRALTVLGKGALCTLDLLDECFNYQKSYKRAHQRLYGGGGYFTKTKSKPQINSAETQAFYSLLTRLKDQGLIEKSENKKSTLWKITTAGFNRLMLLKEREVQYDVENDGKPKIVAYDVPEKERAKRLWISEALRMMNFKPLQKSLSVGSSKIPEAFLEDLRRKKMLSYTHIFEVSKTGTIRELV